MMVTAKVDAPHGMEGRVQLVIKKYNFMVSSSLNTIREWLIYVEAVNFTVDEITIVNGISMKKAEATVEECK